MTFQQRLSNYQKAYGMPVSSDSEKSDSDSDSEPQMFIFLVESWGDIQQWHLCTVIASDEKECCDFLKRKYSSTNDEIEEAVSEAKRFELKDTSQKTGIIAVA